MTNNQLKIIFAKTEGHCHFCGDSLVFGKYGCKDINNLIGSWEADHIIQKGKGGPKLAKNCLPACVRCNRLRWHRKGKDLRELLLLGIISKKEIKRKSFIGKQLLKLKANWIEANKKRRR